MKTQFMTLWDGLTSNENNRILIIGATNRPQDVDSAILRRMPALFNIGMPVNKLYCINSQRKTCCHSIYEIYILKMFK